MEKNDKKVIGTPDFSFKSKKSAVLKGGEVISQSDFKDLNRAFNAVKLFDYNKKSFWHCQVKGGKYFDNLGNAHVFKTNPYYRTNLYTSVYQGGNGGDAQDETYFVTPILGSNSVAGSWCQITYPYSSIPTSMYIMVRPNFTVPQQAEIPKKFMLLGSKDGDTIPDEKKTFELISEVDYGTKYATTLKFSYKSGRSNPFIFRGKEFNEYFTLILNGKEYKSYTCSVSDSPDEELIHIGGLDSLAIYFHNREDFTDDYKDAGIKFTEFTVNGKNVIDFIRHDTNDPNMNPVSGYLRFAEGYHLNFALPGDSSSDWAKPLPIDYNNFRNVKPYRTYRLVITELYGGSKFNLSYWGITGDKTEEGFTTQKMISSDIFSSIFNNTPNVTGISLVEGYNNYEYKISAIENEKRIVTLLDSFNKAYFRYVKCNGRHLSDNNRNANPPCDPAVDYFRMIRRVKIEMTVSTGIVSGSNQWTGFSFSGRKHGAINDEQIGSKFIVTQNIAYTAGQVITPIILEGDSGENSLQELFQFAGQLKSMSLEFGTSKLEASRFKVTVTDNRGESKIFLDLASDDIGGVIDEFAENRNTVLVLPGNMLTYYSQGLNDVTNYYGQLISEIDSLEATNLDLTDAINLDNYNINHNVLKNKITSFNDLRYDLDTKLRELYLIEGSTSASKKLQYDGTMFAGILWSVLATSVVYYTLYELD